MPSPEPSGRFWGPSILPFSGTWVLTRGEGNLTVREFDHSPPSSDEGTNKWSNVSSSPICLYVVDSDRFYKTDLTKLLELRHPRRLATVIFTNNFTFAILGSKSISRIRFLFSPTFWTSKYLVTCTFLYRLSLPAKETNTCFVSAIRSCSLYITESIKFKTCATTLLLT